jgi:hypothetical protein
MSAMRMLTYLPYELLACTKNGASPMLSLAI